MRGFIPRGSMRLDRVPYMSRELGVGSSHGATSPSWGSLASTNAEDAALGIRTVGHAVERGPEPGELLRSPRPTAARARHGHRDRTVTSRASLDAVPDPPRPRPRGRGAVVIGSRGAARLRLFGVRAP